MNITREQLEQKYKLELEILENRETLKQYSQDILTQAVKKDSFKSVLDELEKFPDRKSYQALGKGYILRKNPEIKKDYTDLLADCDKEAEEIRKKSDKLVSENKELEKTLIETIKYMKIGAV